MTRPLQIPLPPRAGFVQSLPAVEPYPAFPYSAKPAERAEWVGDAPLSGAPAKAIMFVLAHHASRRNGVAYPSRERIAAWAGLDERTVMRRLLALERGGWLVRQERWQETTLHRLKSPWEAVCPECFFALMQHPPLAVCPACGGPRDLLTGGALPPDGGRSASRTGY